ncbi:MAG: hypothetical protein AB1393_10155 [Candidatus Edwardsbacteria bacterium]
MRAKNKKEIRDAIDVPREEFIRDFAEIFRRFAEVLGENPNCYFNRVLDSFDETLKKVGGDVRHLWDLQSILFCDILSEGKINLREVTKEDPTKGLSISLAIQKLRIDLTNVFDTVVLGKKE